MSRAAFGAVRTHVSSAISPLLLGKANYYSASTKKCEYARVTSNLDLGVRASCFPL